MVEYFSSLCNTMNTNAKQNYVTRVRCIDACYFFSVLSLGYLISV